MDDRITKIRQLLEELEADVVANKDQEFVRNFDALELPGIVASVIDYLQPALRPYEAAVYWHVFRESILRTGQPYCRVSTRGLMQGVVLSASGQSDALALQTTRETLQGLEAKGVMLKVGEPNREGTLYKVLLPEEIPFCRQQMVETQACSPSLVDTTRDLDFYNVAENRLKVFERDGYRCHNCEKQLTRFTATLDHLQPVSKGGDNSFQNLITACLHCNSRRGNRSVMDLLANGSKSES
jgi:HNH endonuclease